MKNIINLKDLRVNMETWITQIKNGKSFTVFRKSKPVFKITPIEDDGNWEIVADLTSINKNGISAKDILKELKNLNA